MSEIKFSDGIPNRKEDYNAIVYPEALLDKKCGGCVRCEKRDRENEQGFHCSMQNYKKDILPTDKACIHWWDKEEHERVENARQEDTENRRKELWDIYSKKEPIKLPIENDGYGMIPMCPICGEMPYSTEQCHWCGQRFIQDKEIEEYNTPNETEIECFNCGGKIKGVRSKYNGHFHGTCQSCGITIHE